MTSRERLTAVLSGEPSDRVPFYPVIGPRLACELAGKPPSLVLTDPDRVSDLTYEISASLGSDAVRVEISPLTEIRHIVEYDWERGDPIKSHDLIDAMSFPSVSELIEGGRVEAARRVAEQAHARDLFVIGNCEGRMADRLARIAGGSDALVALMLDEPHMAWQYFSRAADACLEVICAYAWVGADAICIGDRRASSRTLTPWAYDRFCVPVYARMVEAAHSMGMAVLMRCHGDVGPLVHKIRRVGVDGVEGIPLSHGTDVKTVSEVLRSRLCVVGGVERSLLRRGVPEQVRREARDCIARAGGRFILGAGGDIPFGTPRDNIRALFEAAWNG